MNIHQLAAQERINTGTTWTNNKDFDRDGYLVIKNLWNAKELYHPVPKERGEIRYIGKTTEKFNHNPIETQVQGSLTRYLHPQYREIHSQIRVKLEKKLGRKLYNTFYCDRFYFPGQELKMHANRDACEISATIHISTNLVNGDEKWPIWIKTPDIFSDKKKQKVITPGEDYKIILTPGDCLVYKGCERPYWREPMPGDNRNKKLFGKEEELYYHQISFYYVLQDGQRAHCAFDAAS